jgi:RND family efflux transporter MFP subunit
MNTQRLNKRLALSLLVLALVAVAAFFIGRGSSTGEAAGQTAMTTETAATTDGERKIIYWRAPMNPSEIYDQPGKSRMGMDLVPVYEDEASGAGVVSIDPVTMQNIGVRTAPVVIVPLERTVRTTGRFAVNEQRTTAVSPKISGWVETLHVNFEGARVQKGQPLLEIYSPELVSTQEEYLLALRHAVRLGEAPDAQRLVEAARRRLAYWDISEAQVQRLEETGEPTKTLTLFAPAAGTVAETKVIEGQKIMAGQTLMKLSNLSTLWLMVDIYEQDLAWVGVGTTASIELPYDPSRTIAGRVSYLYDELDAATRTVKARVEVPNPGLKLKPAMYATVYLLGGRTEAHPVVPSEAVIRTGDREVVILALGEGRFMPAEVETGVEADGRVQILSGLIGNEEVVTSAQFLIDSEARLASAVSAMRRGQDGQAPAPNVAPPDAAEVDHSQMQMGEAPAAEMQMQEGVQVVKIDVTETAFDPAHIRLQKGMPAQIVFTRHAEKTCATSVVIPALGVEATPLPLHEAVNIDVTPQEDGTFTFACSMDMLKGTLVVTNGT